MKILIFSVAYHPFIGGAEIAVKEITDRISDTEFHMITVNIDGKQKAEEKIGNVHVYRVGRGKVGKYLMPFLGVKKALSLQRENRFDATWSIMASYNGFAALMFKILKPQVPFILTLQEGDPIDYIKGRVGFFAPIFSQIFRRATRIQAISNYLADFARSMGTEKPIVVIPNGVDISAFTKSYGWSELEDTKNRLGKRVGDVFLVTTSRLVEKNGVSDVIEALPRLPQNIKFLVVGTGELEHQFRDLATHLQVADRVKLIGFVSHQELPKYLKISDIFIRPSISEGLGSSFIEAMAAGIPVIATRVGGIPDFLTEGVTGYFCEVKSPKSIAETVEKVLADGSRRQNIIENAKELVIKQYDWNLVAKRMKNEVFAKIA
ncbi:MAG TPA: glycosyltransferase family 4 protein [Candidatus Nanoarchaeia archaeon]|nr:glycosyltransferase family 4 protein [Candidatus Nanoarchaeia archaeon]